MAVDDDEAVVGLVEQERLADPAKVGLLLLVDSIPGRMPAWTNKIVAEAAAIDEALAGIRHARREWRCDDHGQRGSSTGRPSACRVDAVALQAFGAAEPQPSRRSAPHRRQDAQQHFLVIAEQETGECRRDDRCEAVR